MTDEEKLEEVEEEYSKRNIIKFAIIYGSVLLLLPLIVGLPLMLVFKNGTYLEAMYIIFGSLSLIYALFRSRRRDTKNIKKSHTLVEDKTTAEYRTFFSQQIIAYSFGLLAIVLSVAIFYICMAIGFTNPF